MLPKVSVIVPIYNVEKYLNRCVDSIINQIYKNIEVILVDDGSPDNSGKIADEYQSKDNRVKSVHKPNGGLSDARNYGMKYATGDYVLFVDSDDWLKLDMIGTLVDVAVEYKAEVVQSAFYYAYDNYLLLDDRYYKETDSNVILDNHSLMKELVINERVKNFAWGKLYKMDLVKDILFEKGVLFEDVFWAHQVMHKVNKYVIVNKPMCYYLQRSDSIVATYTPRNLDILKGLKERHKFITTYYKNLTSESNKLILQTSLVHYNLLLANKDKDNDGHYRTGIQEYIKDNYRELKESVESDKHLDRQLSLFNINPTLCNIYQFSYRALRKLKIVPQPQQLKKVSYDE